MRREEEERETAGGMLILTVIYHLRRKNTEFSLGIGPGMIDLYNVIIIIHIINLSVWLSCREQQQKAHKERRRGRIY